MIKVEDHATYCRTARIIIIIIIIIIINLTSNPDRSSLVQLYLSSFIWMDLRVLLLLLQSRTKE